MSLTPIENAVFENEIVIMDGKYFNGCTLTGCTLIFSGGDFGWIDTKINMCMLRFEGAAARTAKYLFQFGKITNDFAIDMGFQRTPDEGKP